MILEWLKIRWNWGGREQHEGWKGEIIKTSYVQNSRVTDVRTLLVKYAEI